MEEMDVLEIEIDKELKEQAEALLPVFDTKITGSPECFRL